MAVQYVQRDGFSGFGPKLAARRSPVLKSTNVTSTELGYVTAVDRKNRTFFTQLCKFTNPELVQFNLQIHNYCKNITNAGLIKSYNPAFVCEGGVYCARYNEDLSWYRVLVTSVRQDNCSCEAIFVDYGNSTELNFSELISVDPDDMSCIEREPFGIICHLKDSERLDEQTAHIMLDAVMEEYVMIRTLEQLGQQKWRVDLPKVAYNSSFWLSYHVARNRLRTGRDRPLEDGEINQQLLSREEMLAAGLDA